MPPITRNHHALDSNKGKPRPKHIRYQDDDDDNDEEDEAFIQTELDDETRHTNTHNHKALNSTTTTTEKLLPKHIRVQYDDDDDDDEDASSVRVQKDDGAEYEMHDEDEDEEDPDEDIMALAYRKLKHKPKPQADETRPSKAVAKRRIDEKESSSDDDLPPPRPRAQNPNETPEPHPKKTHSLPPPDTTHDDSLSALQNTVGLHLQEIDDAQRELVHSVRDQSDHLSELASRNDIFTGECTRCLTEIQAQLSDLAQNIHALHAHLDTHDKSMQTSTHKLMHAQKVNHSALKTQSELLTRTFMRVVNIKRTLAEASASATTDTTHTNEAGTTAEPLHKVADALARGPTRQLSKTPSSKKTGVTAQAARQSLNTNRRGRSASPKKQTAKDTTASPLPTHMEHAPSKARSASPKKGAPRRPARVAAAFEPLAAENPIETLIDRLNALGSHTTHAEIDRVWRDTPIFDTAIPFPSMQDHPDPINRVCVILKTLSSVLPPPAFEVTPPAEIELMHGAKAYGPGFPASEDEDEEY